MIKVTLVRKFFVCDKQNCENFCGNIAATVQKNPRISTSYKKKRSSIIHFWVLNPYVFRSIWIVSMQIFL